MNERAVEWAFRQTQVSQRARWVLVSLAILARPGSRCVYLPQVDIGEQVGLCDRRVRSLLKELEKAGLIIRTRINRFEGGRDADEIAFKVLPQ